MLQEEVKDLEKLDIDILVNILYYYIIDGLEISLLILYSQVSENKTLIEVMKCMDCLGSSFVASDKRLFSFKCRKRYRP